MALLSCTLSVLGFRFTTALLMNDKQTFALTRIVPYERPKMRDASTRTAVLNSGKIQQQSIV
jgi:hypothetical protein